MGHLQAREMASHAPLDQALAWHLQSNHYPPVHPVFIPVAKEAIQAAVRDHFHFSDEADEEVVLPNGVTKTYGAIVAGLHLEAFVENEVEMALLELSGEDGEQS